jgi:hypothetical protein
MIAGAALALGATLPAEANEQEPYRVRGTLESVENNKLTVNTREGEAGIGGLNSPPCQAEPPDRPLSGAAAGRHHG